MKTQKQIVKTILETVPESGVSSSALYAALMPFGVGLAAYNGFLRVMEETGTLAVANHQIKRGANYARALAGLAE